MAKGQWIDPARSLVVLQEYAARWIEQRPGLRPRTLQLYRWTLRRHISPYLGGVPLGQLDTAMLREWRARLLADGVSAGMAAKAYRLLRAVLMTAVNEDEILPRNPCRIPGADKESPDERPTLTVTEVRQLVEATPDRYRMMVFTAAMASLRFGEITALRRRDVDLGSATIRVREQYVEVKGQGLVASPPKSRAGIRLFDTVRLGAVARPASRYVCWG
jgi:integrase